MTRAEERLAELMQAVAPPVAGVAFGEVVARVRRRRTVRLSTIATACVAVFVVGAVLIGGGWPGRTPHPVAHSVSDLVALTAKVPCPGVDQPASRAQLDRFHAVTVVTCDEEVRVLPGDGQWSLEVRRVATGGVAGLVAAFERPDAAPTRGPCAAYLVLTPTVVLVDAAGRALVPTPPVDDCLRAQPTVQQAYDKMKWHVVSTRKLRQLESAAATAAGCPQNSKDLVRIYRGASAGGPLFAHVPVVVHVCVYRAVADDPLEGAFDRGSILSPADSGRLLAAMAEGAGPIGSCQAQPEFAAVLASVNDWASVELGGCWRVGRSFPRSGIGSADAAVMRAIIDKLGR